MTQIVGVSDKRPSGDWRDRASHVLIDMAIPASVTSIMYHDKWLHRQGEVEIQPKTMNVHKITVDNKYKGHCNHGRIRNKLMMTLQSNHSAHGIRKKENQLFIESIINCKRIVGATHNFYRYPARYSPEFVRAAINLFSEPGDTVLDPFMGGGTTIVEGLRLGRRVIGSDINQLSCFITSAKTTDLSDDERDELVTWIEDYDSIFDSTILASEDCSISNSEYLKNLDTNDILPIKKIIISVLQSLKKIAKSNTELFLRSVLLNTSQWALDCRSIIPSEKEFKDKFLSNIHEMIEAINIDSVIYKVVSSFQASVLHARQSF